MKAEVFAARLGNVLKDNMFKRRVFSQRRGDLDGNRVYKAEINQENVFVQQKERKNKNYMVYLLVDVSGSMAGHKVRIASQVAVFLARAFQIVKIPVQISAFNQVHHVFRSFDQTAKISKSEGEEMANEMIYMAAGSTPGAFEDKPGYSNTSISSCNHDHQYILEALETLNNFNPKQKAHKIFICISDGSPACARYTKYCEDGYGNIHIPGIKRERYSYQCEPIAEDVRHYKDITTLGIGVNSSARQFPVRTRRIIDSPEHIQPIITNFFRHKIQRS